MILRSWHGAVPLEQGNAFERYLQATGVAEAIAVPGNLGAFVKRVVQDEFVHFFLLTYWDGWDAIHRFAGEEPQMAVTYPQDRQYGLISDPLVLHQNVSSVTPWFGETDVGSSSIAATRP